MDLEFSEVNLACLGGESFISLITRAWSFSLFPYSSYIHGSLDWSFEGPIGP